MTEMFAVGTKVKFARSNGEEAHGVVTAESASNVRKVEFGANSEFTKLIFTQDLSLSESPENRAESPEDRDIRILKANLMSTVQRTIDASERNRKGDKTEKFSTGAIVEFGTGEQGKKVRGIVVGKIGEGGRKISYGPNGGRIKEIAVEKLTLVENRSTTSELLGTVGRRVVNGNVGVPPASDTNMSELLFSESIYSTQLNSRQQSPLATSAYNMPPTQPPSTIDTTAQANSALTESNVNTLTQSNNRKESDRQIIDTSTQANSALTESNVNTLTQSNNRKESDRQIIDTSTQANSALTESNVNTLTQSNNAVINLSSRGTQPNNGNENESGESQIDVGTQVNQSNRRNNKEVTIEDVLNDDDDQESVAQVPTKGVSETSEGNRKDRHTSAMEDEDEIDDGADYANDYDIPLELLLSKIRISEEVSIDGFCYDWSSDGVSYLLDRNGRITNRVANVLLHECIEDKRNYDRLMSYANDKELVAVAYGDRVASLRVRPDGNLLSRELVDVACPFCNQHCASILDLNTHMNTHHQDDFQMLNDERPRDIVLVALDQDKIVRYQMNPYRPAYLSSNNVKKIREYVRRGNKKKNWDCHACEPIIMEDLRRTEKYDNAKSRNSELPFMDVLSAIFGAEIAETKFKEMQEYVRKFLGDKLYQYVEWNRRPGGGGLNERVVKNYMIIPTDFVPNVIKALGIYIGFSKQVCDMRPKCARYFGQLKNFLKYNHSYAMFLYIDNNSLNLDYKNQFILGLITERLVRQFMMDNMCRILINSDEVHEGDCGCRFCLISVLAILNLHCNYTDITYVRATRTLKRKAPHITSLNGGNNSGACNKRFRSSVDIPQGTPQNGTPWDALDRVQTRSQVAAAAAAAAKPSTSIECEVREEPVVSQATHKSNMLSRLFQRASGEVPSSQQANNKRATKKLGKKQLAAESSAPSTLELIMAELNENVKSLTVQLRNHRHSQ